MGKFILFSNIGLFILILVFFGLKGFTEEELGTLLRYLIPIKSIYLTAVVKFVIDQRGKDPATDRPQPVSPLYHSVTRALIYTHILLLYLLIILSAFNAISFDFLVNSLVVIESLFGIYIGLIVSDMFKTTGTVDGKRKSQVT